MNHSITPSELLKHLASGPLFLSHTIWQWFLEIRVSGHMNLTAPCLASQFLPSLPPVDHSFLAWPFSPTIMPWSPDPEVTRTKHHTLGPLTYRLHGDLKARNQTRHILPLSPGSLPYLRFSDSRTRQWSPPLLTSTPVPLLSRFIMLTWQNPKPDCSHVPAHSVPAPMHLTISWGNRKHGWLAAL